MMIEIKVLMHGNPVISPEQVGMMISINPAKIDGNIVITSRRAREKAIGNP